MCYCLCYFLCYLTFVVVLAMMMTWSSVFDDFTTDVPSHTGEKLPSLNALHSGRKGRKFLNLVLGFKKGHKYSHQGAIVSGHVLISWKHTSLERLLFSSKMCAFSWSKHGRLQSPLLHISHRITTVIVLMQLWKFASPPILVAHIQCACYLVFSCVAWHRRPAQLL